MKFQVGDDVVINCTYPGRSGKLVAAAKNLFFFIGNYEHAHRMCRGWIKYFIEATVDQLMEESVYYIYLEKAVLPCTVNSACDDVILPEARQIMITASLTHRMVVLERDIVSQEDWLAEAQKMQEEI